MKHDAPSNDIASHKTASHKTASHETASHETAPHETASHATAPHETASHETAPHETARHETTPYEIALIGNPNSGKTTLFNALTGNRQRVGNWPGVTVDRKSGAYTHQNETIEVIDLPGTYSLITSADDSALDEKIACDYLVNGNASLIINVVDAANLERNLYLTVQLLEMGVPVLLALNMLDIAKKRHIQIDTEKLANELGCRVVSLVANKQKGIDELKKEIHASLQEETRRKRDLNSPSSVNSTSTANTANTANTPNTPIHYPKAIQANATQLSNAITRETPNYQRASFSLALRLLEGDHFAEKNLATHKPLAQQLAMELANTLQDDIDSVIADHRYGFVHKLTQEIQRRSRAVPESFTAKLDRLFLHRYFGLPLFFVIMYGMFLFAINIGGVFQDFFDLGSEAVFVNGMAAFLQTLHCPAWIIALLASGVGRGINTTVTFIPVIGAMFLYLSILESTGYMARAAFVMDRVMRALGLPGKAFVPLIVGFGCNVPAIMATRTLTHQRDRILTTMMTPFMSCGARLAIFAVFAAAFFPTGGQNIVFLLYLIGIAMAVATGFILRKTLLIGQSAPFIMELPIYHMPTLRVVLRHTWQRLKRFLTKAGKVILPLCMLLGVLNALDVHGHIVPGGQHSLLAALGRTLTPLFAPIGIQHDNWPATVGLLTGTLAKEVVVATLNTLYAQVGHLHHASIAHFNLWEALGDALNTIPENLRALPSAFGNPIMASAPDSTVTKGVYGVMYQYFGGQAAAFSYLLFVLLYVPCVSTVAVMAREVSRLWTTFSVIWSTGMAYGVAVIFYQLSQWQVHPVHAVVWIAVVSVVVGGSLLAMRTYAQGQRQIQTQEMVSV